MLLHKFQSGIYLIENAESYNLERMYRKFNDKYFGNKLPSQINISWKKLKGNTGGQAWSGKGINYIEINTEMKKYGSEIIDSILVHEMIHLLLPNNGHGHDFKAEAKRIDKINPDLKLIDGGKVKQISPALFYNLMKNDIKEVIPVYVCLFYYAPDEKATVGRVSDAQFFSSDKDVESEVQKVFARGHENVAYIYSVKMNTEYFLYKDYAKFINRSMDFNKNSLKYIAGLVLKNKKDVDFYKKVLFNGQRSGLIGMKLSKLIG